MRSLRETIHSTPATIVALALLVLGIGVHAFFNQPRIDEIGGLQRRHASLLGQAGALARADKENQELARIFAGGDAGLRAGASLDPLTFIGRTVDAAGLNRIEMGTEASGTTGGLQVTRFTLRVSGTYPRIVDFVRSLEQGARTVTVLSLAVEPIAESTLLEARMHLSVYDPIARR